ncbi:uncharacterized protein [Ptychodera flava]|uniref:uncharacterized protein n=1 Tax=Ptychodera flava TaxID=63121 RepID=UPI00396A8FC3
MDLSRPNTDSVNTHICKEDYTLSYGRVDNAVAIIQKYGKGTLMTKVDIRYAFRLCPVRKEDWHLLGFKWLDHYFFDRVLPFGLRSAPFLFDHIADAIHWIISRRADTEDLLHYLDDYFGAGPPRPDKCQQLLNTMVSVCHDLGVPTAPEKIEGPSPIIIFLGIELDTIKMVMRLPNNKLTDLIQALPTWIQQQSCTKRQLLSLIGTLSFACKCIPAGRIFIRRMMDLSTTVKCTNDIITLSDDFRLDVQ